MERAQPGLLLRLRDLRGERKLFGMASLCILQRSCRLFHSGYQRLDQPSP